VYTLHTNTVLEVVVLGIPGFLRQDPKANIGLNDFVTLSTFVCWLASHQNGVSLNLSVQESIRMNFIFGMAYQRSTYV